MYLRVKPQKSTPMTSNCAKLAPQFCGQFEILDRIGPVAYQLVLPARVKVHNVFHVSLLKKYVHDNYHIINWNLL